MQFGHKSVQSNKQITHIQNFLADQLLGFSNVLCCLCFSYLCNNIESENILYYIYSTLNKYQSYMKASSPFKETL